MERMIERADELKLPFQELVDAFGYADKFEGYPPNNAYIWLTLEHIWCSFDYRKEDVVDARETKGLWMAHICLFPMLENGGPIYGFDVIAGKKVFFELSCNSCHVEKFKTGSNSDHKNLKHQKP